MLANQFIPRVPARDERDIPLKKQKTSGRFGICVPVHVRVCIRASDRDKGA